MQEVITLVTLITPVVVLVGYILLARLQYKTAALQRDNAHNIIKITKQVADVGEQVVVVGSKVDGRVQELIDTLVREAKLDISAAFSRGMKQEAAKTPVATAEAVANIQSGVNQLIGSKGSTNGT